MQAIYSVMVAVVMLLNVCGAFTQNLQEPVRLDVSIETNREAILDGLSSILRSGGVRGGATEEAAQYAKVTADTLNVLSLHGTADQQGLEAALLAGGETLVSLGLRQDEQGITAVSSLLEGQALTLSEEMVDQLVIPVEQLAGPYLKAVSSAISADQHSLLSSLHQTLDAAVDRLEDLSGETQNGDYLLENQFVFTKKSQVEVEYQEFVTLLMDALEVYFAQDALTELTALPGEKANPLTAVRTIKKDMEALEEELLYDTEVTLYENDDGEQMIIADLRLDSDPDNRRIHLYFGTEGGNARSSFVILRDSSDPSAGDFQIGAGTLRFTGLDDLTVSLDLGIGDGMFIVLNGEWQGSGKTSLEAGVRTRTRTKTIYLRACADFLTEGQNTTGTIRLLLDEGGEDAELAVLHCDIGPGERTMTDQGIETVSLDEILSDEEKARELTASLSANALPSLENVLNQLTAFLPEESGQTLTDLLRNP